MAKIAYLIGISGSGKTYVGKQLQGEVQYLKVDRLRNCLAVQWCPSDPPRLCTDWALWDEHLSCREKLAMFADRIERIWPQLHNDAPVLAEAMDLGYSPWRNAFRQGLMRRGITITAEQVFWIDPPAERILDYRQRRDRSGQRTETLHDVEQHRQWYQERIGDLIPPDCQYEDATTTRDAIRAFLLT